MMLFLILGLYIGFMLGLVVAYFMLKDEGGDNRG